MDTIYDGKISSTPPKFLYEFAKDADRLFKERSLYRQASFMKPGVKPISVTAAPDSSFLPSKAALAPFVGAPSNDRIHRCPYHTDKVFDVRTLPLVARWAETKLLESRVDAIVACGHSGLVLAGALSFLTRLPVFAVRKRDEPTVAASGPVSGIAPNGRVKRWAWVDDLIGSGGTMRYSCQQVYREGLVTTPIPSVVLLYTDSGSEKWKEPLTFWNSDKWEKACEDVGYEIKAEEGWHQFSYTSTEAKNNATSSI